MYHSAKLLSMVNGIKAFKVKTPIQFNMKNKDELVNITSVKIYFTNATNVRITIKANSAGEQKFS